MQADGLVHFPLGSRPYQGEADSQCASEDRWLVMCVKPRPYIVDRVQLGWLWAVLRECLDSFHGKLDEDSST